MIPDRIGEDVRYIDWLSSMNGCAAGSTFWTDEHRSCARDETRKTWSRRTIELPSVIGAEAR